MTDDERPPESGGRSELTAAEAHAEVPAVPDDQFAARATRIMEQLLHVEQLRHDREARKIALQEKALDVVDAQDKRQSDFHNRRLELNDKDRRSRFDFGRWVVWASFGFVAVLFIGNLALLFFGGQDQQDVAERILGTMTVGLAGYGVIAGALHLAKSLVQRDP